MPMPKPGKDESQEDFKKRFMADEGMMKEYPEEKQRYAVCMEQWGTKQKNMSDENKIETIDLNEVPIFSAGTWNGETYTEKDLDEIIDSFENIGKELKPMLKLGHDEKQILLQRDGYPSAGWITELKRKGNKLVANFKQVPNKIGDLIKNKAYGRLSSELFINLKHGDKIYPKALRAVALLGGDTPAVTSLDDFINLYSENDYEMIKNYIYQEVESMDSEQIKKFEMQIKEKDNEINEMKTKIDEYEKDKVKIFKQTVESFLDETIKSGKITPAQKPVLLQMSSDDKNFDLVKKFIEDQVKVIEFSEQSKKTEIDKTEKTPDEKLDMKIKTYAKENKIGYREAYRIVAMEEGGNE